jgi:hypothetical protein
MACGVDTGAQRKDVMTRKRPYSLSIRIPATAINVMEISIGLSKGIM